MRGKPGHSSGIFSKDDGAGAIYEAARILHTFYDELRGEPYLTFNAGLVLGGNSVEHGRERGGGTASGKSNIIPQSATVTGDLRTLTAEQLARTKERMRAIVGKNLAHTSAEIKFEDGYPPMAPTEGNKALLRELDLAPRNSCRVLAKDVQKHEKVPGPPVEDAIQLSPVVAAKLSKLTLDLRAVGERKMRLGW